MSKNLFRDGISKEVILGIYGINKKVRKTVLIMMAFLMIVGSVLPKNYQSIYAEEPQEPVITEYQSSEERIDYPSTTDDNFDITSVSIDKEVESLRTIDSKTFKRVDGTYEFVMYGNAHTL